MSRIKNALHAIENLRELAANLEFLVKAIQEGEIIVPEAKAEIKTEPLKIEPITIEKVRAFLAEKSQSGKQSQVKALIVKYGANKLTDIDPACYSQLLAEAEAL
jgi:hypothetical protein